VTDEILFHRAATVVRRLHLAPGEAMPWHCDRFHRVAVVLRGGFLLIEYRDGGKDERVEIMPGRVEGEEPSSRVHWAVMPARGHTSK